MKDDKDLVAWRWVLDLDVCGSMSSFMRFYTLSVSSMNKKDLTKMTIFK